MDKLTEETRTCLALIRRANASTTADSDSLVSRRAGILFDKIIKPATTEAGYACIQVDPLEFSSNDPWLFRLLESADAVLVDLTGSTANEYLYGMGARHALTNKPTIVFTDEIQRTRVMIDTNSVNVRGIEHAEEADLCRVSHHVAEKLRRKARLHHFSPIREVLDSVPRVFLSYAHDDLEAVLAVDQWLRDQGARVDIDERNFIAGKDIRDEVVRHIKQAAKVVCFFSVSSSSRYYPTLERRIAEEVEKRAQDSGVSKTILLFFRLDDTPLPTDSSHRLAINAWTMEFEEACEELWRNIHEKAGAARRIDLSTYSLTPPWKLKSP